MPPALATSAGAIAKPGAFFVLFSVFVAAVFCPCRLGLGVVLAARVTVMFFGVARGTIREGIRQGDGGGVCA